MLSQIVLNPSFFAAVPVGKPALVAGNLRSAKILHTLNGAAAMLINN